jgi:hypothetical protein
VQTAGVPSPKFAYKIEVTTSRFHRADGARDLSPGQRPGLLVPSSSVGDPRCDNPQRGLLPGAFGFFKSGCVQPPAMGAYTPFDESE